MPCTTPADVDVDDRVPLVQRQQFGVTAPADARVVEHQVESAGTADHLVDHRLHGRRIGDVEARGARRLAEPGRGLLRGVAVDVGADDVGARI